MSPMNLWWLAISHIVKLIQSEVEVVGQDLITSHWLLGTGDVMFPHLQASLVAHQVKYS